ncbi:MAG: universal stress protein [Novipirellula sp. JB048]
MAAGDFAAANCARLKIVDVVPPFSWMTRMLVSDHEHIRDLMIREKQEQLDVLAAPLRERDLSVTTKVLCGKTSVEIIREVLRDQHDLVMRIAKGADSRREGAFGTTGMRLLRECPCVVNLVTSTKAKPTHLLACIDTSTGHADDTELNKEILELGQAISASSEARFSIIQAWSIDGEQLLDGRMTAREFFQMKENRETHVRRLLNESLQAHGCSTDDEHVFMIKGNPTEVIPDFVKQNGVDLVVMGTVGRSGAAGVLVGNTAEQILDSIECSVIALKPRHFVSPIKMGDYVTAEESSE